MFTQLALQAAEEGGGTQIDLGVIALVAVAVIAAVVWFRRRR
jgi:Flp pilus assembly pilin Flp